MQNQLFPNLPEEARKQVLSDNCDRVEELEYLKSFGPDQIAQKKDTLSEVSISINDVEEEKKAVTADYNESLKQLNKKKKKLLEDLRNKAERVTEHCYLFFDHDAKLVGYYNQTGQLVNSRSMRPGEYQKTTFGVIRGDEAMTGTND